MPFGDATPNAFVSAALAEGGEDSSNVLHHVSRDGRVTGLLLLDGTWTTGDGSDAPAATNGDSFVLLPATGDPFELFVYGRIPSAASAVSPIYPGLNLLSFGYPSSEFSLSSITSVVTISGTADWMHPSWVSNRTDDAVEWTRKRPYAAPTPGYPRFDDFYVSPDGRHSELSVSSGGGPFDLLSVSSCEGFPSPFAWSHLGRFADSIESVLLRDDGLYNLLGTNSAAFYLVSDATRDTDGDGISDVLESRVYGTSPLLADSDGDGRPDGLELAWATDPFVADAPAPFSFFEGFELPDVSPGDLDGQHGWSATGVVATVQSESVRSGSAALRISGGDPDNPGEVSRAIASTNRVLWLDLHVIADFGGGTPPPDGAAVSLELDAQGHPVALDGSTLRTNLLASAVEDAWTRFTCRVDLDQCRWDLYLDGVIVFEGLQTGASPESLSEIALRGNSGGFDDFSVSSERPHGLSSDGDPLPDEWEQSVFATLDRDGSGDADGDGLPDADEWRSGANPLVSDTDGDGIPDGWETANGLSPTDSADAVSDADGDGMSNVLEYSLGTDPYFPELDPRLSLPGLRAEFLVTDGSLQDFSAFSALEPFLVTVAPVVDWPARPWPDAVSARADRFACRLAGFVCIPSDGHYTFYATADDGVELSVDNVVVVSDPAPHSQRERTGAVALTAGWHPLSVRYYENAGQEVLSLKWSGPGIAKSVISAESLRHYPENLPPRLALSVNDSVPVEGGSVVLTATATDADGEIAELAIMEGATTLAAASGPSVAATVAGLSAGTHVFRAVATDDSGAVAESELTVVAEPAPAGYALGLEASFYAFGTGLSAIPETNGLNPVSSGIVDKVSYPSTDGAWEGAPEGLANRFAAVFKGALCVREAGIYTLTVSSDDGSRLWIDGTAVVVNDGCHSASAKSAAVPLSRGLHPLRLEYFENTGHAVLELSWTPPGGARTAIPPRCLFHATAVELDSDGDGLPDWWEEWCGLDSADSSDAALDPDSPSSRQGPIRIPRTPTAMACPTDGRPRTARFRSSPTASMIPTATDSSPSMSSAPGQIRLSPTRMAMERPTTPRFATRAAIRLSRTSTGRRLPPGLRLRARRSPRPQARGARMRKASHTPPSARAPSRGASTSRRAARTRSPCA